MKSGLIFLLLFFTLFVNGQTPEASRIKGLCVGAPAREDVDEFIAMIEKELAPAGLNTLILRVDWGYEYSSHPELVGEHPLQKKDIRKLVKCCQEHAIRLIPQINLLGHQSWATKPGRLLEVYPEFDETPGVKFPEEYQWPNPDGLYCKSYCPLHPDVHRIVFDLVDEIVDVFEADAFHAGMDEVFYLGHEQCPRCNGLDPAVLFAGEVTKIRNHLAESGKELWIWGDRLIDGKTTGIGEWEGSYNNTHRAIDLIPKDVMICDWHYETAHPTPVLFASKGLRVAACPWRDANVAVEQVSLLNLLRKNSSREMAPRYAGMVHTYWSSARSFMDGMAGKTEKALNDPSVKCFRELVKQW
ncbi:MAG TPA: family 20 glycosylhydrolase [Prolixibacteraceae bacterium]|nr:family 20 glycosylhydrolase [Prolixibacteraceae bacterium]